MSWQWPLNDGLRLRRALVAFATTTFLLSGGRSATATESSLFVRLRYGSDLPEGRCWSEQEFRRGIVQRVGYDPFRNDAATSISIHLSGSPRMVSGTVDWRGADEVPLGERRFVVNDGNCAKLMTEMTFAVALQIQLLRSEEPTNSEPGSAPMSASLPSTSATNAPPSAVAPPQAAQQSSSPATTAPDQPNQQQQPAPNSDTSPRDDRPGRKQAPAVIAAPHQWSYSVGAGAAMVTRIAPALSGGLRLFLGLQRDNWSLEFGPEATYPVTKRYWDGSGFRLQWIGLGTAACGHFRGLSACLLGKASQIRVRGLDVDEPRTPTGTLAQAGLRLAATASLGGRWFASARLDGLGLLTPCTINLNRTRLWESPRFSATAGLDLSVQFR